MLLCPAVMVGNTASSGLSYADRGFLAKERGVSSYSFVHQGMWTPSPLTALGQELCNFEALLPLIAPTEFCCVYLAMRLCSSRDADSGAFPALLEAWKEGAYRLMAVYRYPSPTHKMTMLLLDCKLPAKDVCLINVISQFTSRMMNFRVRVRLTSIFNTLTELPSISTSF